MNVLIVEPGYAPYEKEINGLTEMQSVVGGYIQAIYPFDDLVACVCNEEAILDGLPFNRSVPRGYGGICGTFFICGLADDNFCSLTSDQIKTYKREFHQAEILVGFQNEKPVTIKVQPKVHGKHPKERRQDTPGGRE